jgi:hypothetical protein
VPAGGLASSKDLDEDSQQIATLVIKKAAGIST